MDKQAIIQDILLDTYWANTVGKTTYPGARQNYMAELERNMLKLFALKVTFSELHDILNGYGYESDDINKIFRQITHVDPNKIVFLRKEMLKNLPPEVPMYSYGFGKSKKGDTFYYVLYDDISSSFGVYEKKAGEKDYSSVKYFLTLNEAFKYISKKTKNIYRFDLPAWEEALQFKGELKFEEDKNYKELDDILYNLYKSDSLTFKKADQILTESVKKGKISYDAAINLMKVYAEDKLDKNHEKDVLENKKEEEEKGPKEEEEVKKENLKEKQEVSMKEELKNKTPVDYFKSSLPNRLDVSVPDQIKSVMVYINNKSSDISKYQIKLYKLNYELQQTISKFVSLNPELGNVANDYIAMINVILEIKDRLSNKVKYGLIVFFISPDGSVSTSDSFKGEDDIVYGLSENGIDQYFSKS